MRRRSRAGGKLANARSRKTVAPRAAKTPKTGSRRSATADHKTKREVSQAINSTLDVETVLTTIVVKAVQLSGTETGAIYTFDESRQEFRLRATDGMDEVMIAAIRDRGIRVGETTI